MIDIGYMGVAGTCSIYLIEGEQSCIIDTGTESEVSTLAKGLRAAKAFPPDKIVLTHSHFDHCQGVPKLRQLAEKEGKDIEVLAHESGVGLLADQSFNRAFDKKGRYEDIEGVTPVKDGDTINLGGATLRVIHTPGHCDDQMSLLHEESSRLFLGDAIGIYLGEKSHVPPFMPANWNLESFNTTIEKLKQVDFKHLCVAHFGCISEELSRNYLDFVSENTKLWWSIYEHAEQIDKIRDYDYLTDKIIEDTGLALPKLELVSTKLKVGLMLLNGIRKVRRMDALPVSRVLMHDFVIPWLSRGYRMYKGTLEK